MRLVLAAAALALAPLPASAGHITECRPGFELLCVPLDTAERVGCAVADVKYLDCP